MFKFIKKLFNPCEHKYIVIDKIPYISVFNNKEYIYNCVLLECEKCHKRKAEYTTAVKPFNLEIIVDKWLYGEYTTDLLLEILNDIGEKHEN